MIFISPAVCMHITIKLVKIEHFIKTIKNSLFNTAKQKNYSKTNVTHN